MCLHFCYLKTKWFKMSASWPVAGFWFWTSPPSINNDKLIMPACETWNMGNSLGNTPDYGLLPEDNFLTEGQRTESTQIAGAALNCGGRYQSLGQIQCLEYLGQGIREKHGPQDRASKSQAVEECSCKSLAESGAALTQSNISHKANHQVTVIWLTAEQRQCRRSIAGGCEHSMDIHKPYYHHRHQRDSL